MKVDTIQTSFTGGEFGKSLHGRTDIAQYKNACEIVENFLPRSYGPAISMPGTRYVATVSDSTLKTRLIPFVFNKSDSYAIEMGDVYMRFFTDRGQVVNKNGTEDLSALSNVTAHWKCDDNITGTGSTTVLDAQTNHNGTATTLTSSLSTTAIVGNGFDLAGIYHISVADHADFTRTASAQPMTLVAWAYYKSNGAGQAIISKEAEYELSIDSSDQLSFLVTSGNADTVLLLHCDGTDASTTFTDSSDSAHTATANGDAQIDTAIKKFGTAAGLFDGTGDFLSIPDSADWDFGTADFTIDFWVSFSTTSGNQTLIDRTNGSDFRISKATNGNLVIEIEGTTPISETWDPAKDTWYHIALTRAGTDLKLFVNGTQLGSTATDSSDMQGTNEIRIGTNEGDTLPFSGSMDEIRILKGTAAFTANFSVPDEPYQASATNSWKVDAEITGGWNFITVVFKGDGTASGDCKIYIDGVSKDLTFTSDSSYTKMSDTSNLFRIGTTSSAGAKNWNDKLDNIAFIQSELTAAQVSSLYSTSAYELATVFKESEVFAVQYTQLNDVVWLTHPDHPPQQLTRTSANEWAIKDFPFTGGPFLDENTDATTITPSATTGTVNLTVTPTTTNLFTLSAATLGHQDAFWMVGGLAQTDATTGLKEVGFVQITDVINGYTATATVIKNLKATTATKVWAEGAWSAVNGYPGSLILHERRLWFARTNKEPQKLWGSKVFEFENYHLDTQANDDGINIGLASNESNEMKFLASGKSLIAGTFGGAFIINSRSAEPITPDNVHAAEEIGYGAKSIQPKRIGNFIYYVQRFGQKLRELFYFWDLDTYKAVDRTILSPLILEDGVIDMGVQQDPETIIYCVRSDGTLVTMTREIDQEVTAWARHTTSGTYTSIAIIPSQSDDYDEAWVIVERWIAGNQRKYVEFFENIEVPARQDACRYLHSGLSYNAYDNTSQSSVTISFSASNGSVTITTSTAYFKTTHADKRLRAIDALGNTLGEGEITAHTSGTSVTLSITTTFNALSYVAGDWGISVVNVAGLDHLDAKTVGILADGNTESLVRTVASNSVTLGSNYFIVHVGLSYDQILFTLPPEAGTVRGTAQGKFQRINEVALKVNRTTQDFKYGPNADDLDDVNLAITPTVTTLYTGIIAPLAMRGGWVRGDQFYLKNPNPLPIELLSIMATLDTQDK